MPWSNQHVPRSMKHLAPEVRDKAISIANALHADGMDEGQAIRISIARATKWAARRGAGLRMAVELNKFLF